MPQNIMCVLYAAIQLDYFKFASHGTVLRVLVQTCGKVYHHTSFEKLGSVGFGTAWGSRLCSSMVYIFPPPVSLCSPCKERSIGKH